MLNKVQVIGNVGKDPEVRHSGDGNAIANVSVAITETWKDKNGSKQEHTEWVPVVIFGKLADVADKYLKKGQKVYFEGKYKTRKWQDKEGNDRYTTEVVVDQRGTMQMLGGKPEGQSKPQNQQNDSFDDFSDSTPF